MPKLSLRMLVVIVPLVIGIALMIIGREAAFLLATRKQNSTDMHAIRHLQSHGFEVQWTYSKMSWVDRLVVGSPGEVVVELVEVSRNGQNGSAIKFPRDAGSIGALKAINDLFVLSAERTDFGCSDLRSLTSAKIIGMRLANTALDDCDLGPVNFPQLMSIDVSHTKAGPKFLQSLESIDSLRSVNAHGTSIPAQRIEGVRLKVFNSHPK